MGTVKIIEVRYTQDEIFEGSIPREAYENAHVTEYDCEDVEEAVHALQREGLSFAATGNMWAANPDGSRTVDYGTGEEAETTGHLDGFTPEQVTEIMERVG